MDRLQLEADKRREEVLRLYLQHQGMLSGFVFALVEEWELVEETLQETAVFVCSHWSDFAPGTNFGAWVRTVARMRCREVLQARRRSRRVSEEAQVGIAEIITDQEWEAHSETSPRQKEALTLCLKALPEKQRRLIEMRYLEQQSCERIADAFVQSLESVYMALTRIRKRLRACMQHRLGKEPV